MILENVIAKIYCYMLLGNVARVPLSNHNFQFPYSAPTEAILKIQPWKIEGKTPTISQVSFLQLSFHKLHGIIHINKFVYLYQWVDGEPFRHSMSKIWKSLTWFCWFPTKKSQFFIYLFKNTIQLYVELCIIKRNIK